MRNRQVEHDPILFKRIVLPPRGDAAASAQAQWPCAQRNAILRGALISSNNRGIHRDIHSMGTRNSRPLPARKEP
jgi:hypothetical protein